MTKKASDLVTRLDDAPITGNHVKVVTAAVLGDLLEFFDFNIIAFVLTFIVQPWELTYGQTTIIMLTAGVGAIIGAIFWGRVADKVGRRPIFIATVLFFSIATGIMYFTPEGSWEFLSFFRFLTGFGVGGLYSVDLPLVQEFVPSRTRGRVSGIVTSFVPIGTMLASTTAAFLSPMIGWRGLFLIGLIPAALTLLIRAWIPESPRWLINHGRFAEAEAAVDWVTGKRKSFKDFKKEDNDDEWINDLPPVPETKITDLFRYKRSVVTTWLSNVMQQNGYYCFNMWGATLLALILGKTPAEAAKMFILVTFCGFLGRWFWSFMSDKLGRRKCGMVIGIGAAVMLMAATMTVGHEIGGVSLFYISMLGIIFFADGGFALTGPYGSEVWPIELRATGMGSAYGMGGIGKILGPMVVAIFAGSSNMVSPAATVDAIFPVYTFIAISFLIYFVVFKFSRETKGKTMEQIGVELEEEASGKKVPYK